MPARDFSILHKLVQNVPRHVGRNCETNSDTAARRRKDLRIDSHEIAVSVNQRASGVASIDRRIGLQEVFKASIAETCAAALCTDDAECNGLADAKRVADGEHDVTNLNLVRICQCQRCQSGLVGL